MDAKIIKVKTTSGKDVYYKVWMDKGKQKGYHKVYLTLEEFPIEEIYDIITEEYMKEDNDS